MAWWTLRCRVMTLFFVLLSVSAFLISGSLYVWKGSKNSSDELLPVSEIVEEVEQLPEEVD